jgi:AmpD protein
MFLIKYFIIKWIICLFSLNFSSDYLPQPTELASPKTYLENEAKIDVQSGRLSIAKFIPSPNQDNRPHNENVNLLVIHNISLPKGKFGNQNVRDLFTNQLDYSKHPSFKTLANLKVSSHLFIRRNGEIVQFVPFHKKAFHAGKSTFSGKEQCNDFSIGIELEGTDDTPFTLAQYKSLALSTTLIIEKYPHINLERIVGHSDIAPSRKTDPGEEFKWQYYRYLVKQMLIAKENITFECPFVISSIIGFI